MKCRITLNLNEKGIKIVGSDTRVLNTNIADDLCKGGDANIIRSYVLKAIDEEFPALNLIDTWTYNLSLINTPVTTPVVIYNPNKDGIVYGEIKRTAFNEICVKVVDKFGNELDGIRFDEFGFEIGPNRKNKRWIEIANEKEIATYQCLKNRDVMITYIRTVFANENWDENGTGIDANDLTNDQLKRIIDIIDENGIKMINGVNGGINGEI